MFRVLIRFFLISSPNTKLSLTVLGTKHVEITTGKRCHSRGKGGGGGSITYNNNLEAGIMT